MEDFSPNPTGFLAVVALLAVVGCDVGLQLGWTPGAATLVILAFPVWTFSLSGRSRHAWIATGIASLACFAETLYRYLANDEPPMYALPALASGLLVSITGGTLHVILPIRKRVLSLQRQLLEEQTRSAAKAEAGGQGEETDLAMDFAMLLMTMQDIGQQIAANLEFERLFPTLVQTARQSLKCRDCRFYLWNPRLGALSDPLQKPVFPGAYLPHPDSAPVRHVLEHRQVLTRERLRLEWGSREAGLENFPFVMAPLHSGGEVLGLLTIDEVEQDTPHFMRLVYVLANLASLGIKNAQLYERIRSLARRDGLTGLLNHATFQQELRQAATESALRQQPLTLLMGDIDHFKSFNDRFGHPAGDQVLREVAALWKAVLPDQAILARYGGEEFIACLPGQTLERGRQLAELLRRTIAEYVIDFEFKQLAVSSSFGVAELGFPATSTEDLIRLADEALYRAKGLGRNTVVASGGNSESVSARP